jgi:hypothetical protein
LPSKGVLQYEAIELAINAETAPKLISSPMSTMSVVSVPKSTSEASIAVEVPPSIFAALWQNGQMMGLTCGTVVPAKSDPVGPHVPATLRPTTLQLTTIHARWIDRWPFPAFRNNVITFNGAFDEEGFLRDLFSMESFSLVPGKPGWDPSAWKISRPFAARWGFLFVVD